MTEHGHITTGEPGEPGRPGEPGTRGGGAGGAGGRGGAGYVDRTDWRRWRWQSIAAFIVLAAANIAGLVMIESESASREQAERITAATARNAAAIGRLTIASCERGNVVRAYLRVNPANDAAHNQTARRLFPIVNCSLRHLADPLPQARQEEFIRRTLAEP